MNLEGFTHEAKNKIQIKIRRNFFTHLTPQVRILNTTKMPTIMDIL
jgi:hypothetical protein